MSINVALRLQEALAPTYELRAKIGEGGMGVVYRAIDSRLQRDVAIKLLPPHLTIREDLRTRFVREAQFVARLSHPNIVQVYDVGEQDDLAWYVMQYVEGETVVDRVDRLGRQSAEFTAQILREVAYALAYAHSRDIVHRDIKPENIMIERATLRALLMDFGIAKATAGDDVEPGPVSTLDDAALTIAGMVVGSATYMSPEQATADSPVDGRSDLYSLGLVAHYMLSGQHVRRGPNARAVLALAVTTKVASARLKRPDLPDWLDAAIAGCTGADRADRYARAEDLLEQLDLGGRSAPVHPGARKVVRWLGALGAATVAVSYPIGALGITPGPLIRIVAVFGAATLLEVLQTAHRAGVRWPDIRRALIEARREWREESVVFGDRSGRSWWKQRVSYVTVVFAALLILLLIRDADGERLIALGGRSAGWLAELLAMGVALTGTLGFTRVFGSPNRRTGLDKEDRWEFPRWLDRLGHLLFSPWGRPKSETALPDAPNQIQPNDETITPPIPYGPNPSTTTTERLLDQAQQDASTIRHLGEK